MPLSPIIKQSFLRDRKTRKESGFIKEAIENFYRDNPGNWRASYPGLSAKRLLFEYESFLGHFQSTTSPGQHQEQNQTIWKSFKQLLIDGVPLQYISHQSYFYNSEFYVDERVLIPRQETELLVEQAIKEVNTHSQETIEIAEVGVGPGTIALSLLQEIEKKTVTYYASDYSKDALEVFKINHFKLGFKISSKHQIKVDLRDRLSGFDKKVDLILSNPPYIKTKADKAGVHHQVLLHEPHEALFIDDDNYDKWFEDFFNQCFNSLKENGVLLMEGHEDHLQKQREQLEEIFNKEAELIQDLTQRDRFLLIRK